MEKIYHYNMSAVLVLGIVLISIYYRRINKSRTDRTFLMVVWEVIATSAIDTVAVMLDNMGPGNVLLKMIFHTGYLYLHALTALFYNIYLITLTGTWFKIRKSRLLQAVLILPALALTAAMAINIFKPIIFYLDESDTYTRGPVFGLLYIVAAFYLVFGLVYIVLHRKLFTMKWILLLFSMYPFIAVAMVAEFFNPYLLLEMFANALSLMFVALHIQNPEETIDPVTGFGNYDTYIRECRKNGLNGKEFADIFINITNFAYLNATFGYDTANKVLKYVAEKAEEINQKCALFADPFYVGEGKIRLMLNNETKYGNIDTGVKKLQEFLNEDVYIDGICVSMDSRVCAIRCPDDISDTESLMIFGDALSTVESDGEAIDGRKLASDRQFLIMRDINRLTEEALNNDSFMVYYQPIYSVEKKKIVSAEALLRLRDEKYGFISPETIVTSAEKNGAIDKIGQVVLNKVCAFVSSLQFQDLGIESIHVNLSAVQCIQDDIQETVSEILQTHHVDSSLINLEITETAVSDTPGKLMENIKKLTDAGFSMDLDDFGSGYSNFQRLSGLPLSTIKLDMSFAPAVYDVKLRTVLENSIKLIKDLGFKIVAEGIETKEMLDLFSSLGCDYIQGYYFSKPLPVDEFMEYVKKTNA